MRVDLRGIHVDVTNNVKEYFDRKIQKLDFAKDIIIDLLVTLSKEKSSFKIEATINFRWGNSAHVSFESFDVLQGIDGIIDKLETKVTKEKEKIQQR